MRPQIRFTKVSPLAKSGKINYLFEVALRNPVYFLFGLRLINNIFFKSSKSDKSSK
jgi:hypothetical protein